MSTIEPPRWTNPDVEPIGRDRADERRIFDAIEGSHKLLRRQVRFGQYPCRVEALGE
jgi:hypothetical protein